MHGIAKAGTRLTSYMIPRKLQKDTKMIYGHRKGNPPPKSGTELVRV
jgi:hypothetical protein